MGYNFDEVVSHLREAFKKEEIKKAVLSEDWYRRNKESGIDSTGFCYAASEILYRLFGTSEVWKVKVISEKKWEHGSHYYLEKKADGSIFDLSADQYTAKGITVPYNLSRPGLLRRPSKGAQLLAKEIGVAVNDLYSGLSSKPSSPKETKPSSKEDII
jgi:hypothetical protein